MPKRVGVRVSLQSSSSTGRLLRCARGDTARRLGKEGLEHALTIEQANKTNTNRPFWRAFTTTFSSPQLALMWISKFKATTSERLTVRQTTDTHAF
jgi:hypothetical protein